jgi:hypothetical protein
MTPDTSKPKPPPADESWWEADVENRDIDKYFHWRFYREAEDRSLDFAVELMAKRRKEAEGAVRPRNRRRDPKRA